MLITYTNSIAVLQERKGMVLVCMGNAGKKINRKQIYLGGISIGVILIMKYIVPMVLPFLIAGFIIIPLYPSLIKVEKRLHIRRSVLAAGLLLLPGAVHAYRPLAARAVAVQLRRQHRVTCGFV